MSIQPASNSDTLVDRRAPDGVRATLTFAAPGAERRRILERAPGADPDRSGPYADREVLIRNARPDAPRLSLDREGFVLIDHETSVRDFHDAQEVETVYYREVERAIEAVTGARAVVAFDHNTRVEGGAARAGDRGAVRVAHNDYTDRSGPRRVRELLPPEDAAMLLAGRFAVINLWRPIAGPVEQWPLAVADASTVAPEAFLPTDLVYDDRVGEIYEVAHGAGQRWAYFPAMDADEALLIKGYDSRTDGTARFVPHTGFADPTSRPGAAPRQSIEVRALVYYGPGR